MNGLLQKFVRKESRTYKSEKHINTTGIDKIHLNCDCNNGSVFDDFREPILYSFALAKLPGHKINKKSRIKLFKRKIKTVLSQINFYLEDDHQKPVDFIGERISFTCQLVKV